MADVAEKLETEDTVENVEKLRSGEGQEEMAGVGEMEGDGDPERNISGEAPGSGSLSCSSMSSDVAYSNISKKIICIALSRNINIYRVVVSMSISKQLAHGSVCRGGFGGKSIVCRGMQ